MCTIYLKLCNLHILVKIHNKRNAVLEYKEEYLNYKLIKSSDFKIEYLVRISYILTA